MTEPAKVAFQLNRYTVLEILARHAPATARINDFCWRLFDVDLHAAYPARSPA